MKEGFVTAKLSEQCGKWVAVCDEFSIRIEAESEKEGRWGLERAIRNLDPENKFIFSWQDPGSIMRVFGWVDDLKRVASETHGTGFILSSDDHEG